MNIFLKKSERYSEDIIMLCRDGAAWHKSGRLKLPESMILFHIPPDTPGMHPIWKAGWTCQRLSCFFASNLPRLLWGG